GGGLRVRGDRVSSGRDRPPVRAGRRHGRGPRRTRGELRRARRGRARAGGLHGAPAVGVVTAGTGLLAAEGLVAGYTATDEILKSVDFVLNEGEIVSIIGPNGAGKSTLLKVI